MYGRHCAYRPLSKLDPQEDRRVCIGFSRDSLRSLLGIMAIFLIDTHIIMGNKLFLPMAARATGPLPLQPTACLAWTALMTYIPVFTH